MSGRLQAPSADRRGQTTLVSAAGAIGVVAGWLAYERWLYPHVLHALTVHTTTGFYLYALLDAMAIYFAPYALVLLVWGRTGPRRLGAALCALATGTYMWGLWVFFDKWIWSENGATAPQASAYDWANLLVISAGIAVAWGIARRSGRIWMLGLLAAPILAASTHELAIRSSWWRSHLLFDDQGSHDLTRQLVFVAPTVLAAVICWMIEVASTAQKTADAVPGPVPVPSASR